jgi:hypothetical protein
VKVKLDNAITAGQPYAVELISTSAAFTACLPAPSRMRSGWGDAVGNCGVSSAIGKFGAAGSVQGRRSGFFRLIQTTNPPRLPRAGLEWDDCSNVN